MHIKNKRGQSTVEYVLLMTAVVAVIIGFVATQNGGFQTQLNTTLNSAVTQVGEMGDRFAGSHALSPANATLPTSSYTVNPTS